MIFTIDRIQYFKNHNTHVYYEFMEVSDIHVLIDDNNDFHFRITRDFFNSLFMIISDIEKDKVLFLLNHIKDPRIFIFYQNSINKYVRLMITANQEFKGKVLSFNELKTWFQKINNFDNVDKQSHSKGLGTVRNENVDGYVNNILKKIYNVDHFIDDNGLALTKSLLDTHTTKGFDLDLFQYIPATNEYIIYEFLKRENDNISNIQAHPMRYCWTGKYNDNKQKFISLWNAKKHLNGKLVLVNYSDDSSEKISLIDVLNLDEQIGFTSENKYCMGQDDFLNLLLRLERLKINDRNYFNEIPFVNYNEDFFESFNKNKYKYGASFLNG